MSKGSEVSKVVRKGSFDGKNELSTNQHQDHDARSATRNAGKEVKFPKATHEFKGQTAADRRRENHEANNLKQLSK